MQANWAGLFWFRGSNFAPRLSILCLPQQKVQAKKEKEEMACWYNQGVHLGARNKRTTHYYLWTQVAWVSISKSVILTVEMHDIHVQFSAHFLSDCTIQVKNTSIRYFLSTLSMSCLLVCLFCAFLDKRNSKTDINFSP